ncbi:RagB/SusD family nutrient uptake outer membrane protein [Paraflavitalea sp. CAU 1676]|uniref:RagB/SusD family nutrient uptake outer membrane protein n=1 Tax=Paraflavitalea sp. CAU 1676 TaxID=3032598 RepID=UPI0023DB6202|nr:RagB/SusD family nutrient uptake outer membrane protein [Paraflavitalea sp. CAU 1676]MDF2192942.1 RagB/SusD family nutrient uptake outer membrane protein [Paraflavitalea sp. CAU 1676]
MYNKIFTIFIAAAVILVSCKKDPELVGPKDQYSTGNYPASIADLESVLAPCYSNLRDQHLFGFNYLTKMMANATHAGSSAHSDPDWLGFIDVSNMQPANGFVAGVWQALYAGVKNCNVALAGADFFEKNYAKEADKAKINYIRGQAYVLRAYYYFQLENLYGEDHVPNPSAADTLGVPVFAGLPAGFEATQQPRAHKNTVWALIESDLQTAATLLKGKVWTGNDVGRASEWSAKGLLGKSYVFRKDWAKAKTVLKEVIDNSGKSLMPYAKYRDAFIGISANEFNEESLFELNIDQDSKGGYGVYSGAANATSINGLIIPPYALGLDGTEGASLPLGYGGNIGLHDKNVLRFGYAEGTYTLVNNPAFDNSKDPSYKNPKQIMDPAYKAKALAVRTDKTADPRLYVSTLQPWLDSVKRDGVNWYPVARPSYIMGDASLNQQYGWSFRKYAPIFNHMDNVGPADAANIYILRLADVYLLYAEACANSSEAGTALEYINKVKRRAYSLPVNTASAIDYASLTDVTMAKKANDPVLGNNPLYYERWAEFFNEGQWWFDMCRWHIGASEAAFYVTARALNGTPFKWMDKAYAWPIPITELNSNPKMAGKQNPGY